MMAMERNSDSLQASLVDRLPAVRGTYEKDVLLADMTWFRVGGPADVLFKPADSDDLAEFLAGRPVGVPITILGVGSNVLVRDGGIRGVVIRLGREFARTEIEDTIVRAGAGTPDVAVALAARDAGIAGLEFLRGVPGTIGGALRMNAGAYGREIADVLVEATAINFDGHTERFSAEDMGFGYRKSSLSKDWVFTSATLRGTTDMPGAIAARMEDISGERVESQPVTSRTGGSTFKNPPGQKAWELIDRAGCRGMSIGGAKVSEQHCNFLINTGDAMAADLESLGEVVRARVEMETGVELEWEIVRVGVAAGSGGGS